MSFGAWEEAQQLLTPISQQFLLPVPLEGPGSNSVCCLPQRALPLLWGSSQLPNKSERKAAGTSSRETSSKSTAQKRQPQRNSKGAVWKHQHLTVPHQQQVHSPAGNKMMLSTPSHPVWPKLLCFHGAHAAVLEGKRARLSLHGPNGNYFPLAWNWHSCN